MTAQQAANILLIEDDPDINRLVTMNLSDAFHAVESCHHGAEGFTKAVSGNYDLIVLDLMLPGLDGLEICRQLRNANIYTPILMLTAKDSEADRVIGLELGADDYLTKPFSVRELLARVKAMLRRVELQSQHLATLGLSNSTNQDILSIHNLAIDTSKRQVRLADKPVELTSTEFDLLLYLAKRPGHVFSRSQLLDAVWGYQHNGYEHTVNSHINRLRNKLENDPSNPQFVLTVWGVGYKFNDQIPF